MYNGIVGVGAMSTGAAGLAATGVSVLWLLLAAFALLGAGMALLRLVPRRQG